MRMNNKGFTLVELLAVLVIIALIGAIAIPNVISIADNNKITSCRMHSIEALLYFKQIFPD